MSFMGLLRPVAAAAARVQLPGVTCFHTLRRAVAGPTFPTQLACGSQCDAALVVKRWMNRNARPPKRVSQCALAKHQAMCLLYAAAAIRACQSPGP
jgi:hypothetical protein